MTPQRFAPCASSRRRSEKAASNRLRLTSPRDGSLGSCAEEAARCRPNCGTFLQAGPGCLVCFQRQRLEVEAKPVWEIPLSSDGKVLKENVDLIDNGIEDAVFTKYAEYMVVKH